MNLSSAVLIVVTGSCIAASCAILGSFMILRRLSMVGDALSHAVLPGIAIAFLLSGNLGPLTMLLGAVVVGILATFFIQSLSEGGVQGDAAIGVTFTSLFALGVVLISLYSAKVHLDLDCVLYGEIAYTPFDTITLGGLSLGPKALWINGGLLILNLLAVSLLFKELKLSAFDPDMAAAVGINVTAMHYLLMSLVALTTVGAFESVGAILVVAYLVAPAATGYLLTDRLERMLTLAVAAGVLAALLGYFLARAVDASISGSMATVCGVFFLLAFLFSPRYGVIKRWLSQRRLRWLVAEEDLLLWSGRRAREEPVFAFSTEGLAEALRWPAAKARTISSRLRRSGLIETSNGSFVLTAAGFERATDLIRRHRIYESYLDNLGYATDHMHAPADRVEHFLTSDIVEALGEETRHPREDPHGRPIPPEKKDEEPR